MLSRRHKTFWTVRRKAYLCNLIISDARLCCLEEKTLPVRQMLVLYNFWKKIQHKNNISNFSYHYIFYLRFNVPDVKDDEENIRSTWLCHIYFASNHDLFTQSFGLGLLPYYVFLLALTVDLRIIPFSFHSLPCICR